MIPITDLLLLAYEAFGGEIKGSTNLQKKMYFLGVMLNFDLGYDAHFYGPYSSEVAASNRELRSLGYVKESIASAGTYSPEGFEIARHDFKISEDARTIIERKKRRYQSEWERLRTAAEKLEQSGDLSYVELSIAAKTYYLLALSGSAANTSEIVNLAGKLNWSVQETQVENAIEFLKRLHLASTPTSIVRHANI